MKEEKSTLYSTVRARRGLRGRCEFCCPDLVTEGGEKLSVVPGRRRGTTELKGKCPACGDGVRFR